MLHPVAPALALVSLLAATPAPQQTSDPQPYVSLLDEADALAAAMQYAQAAALLEQGRLRYPDRNPEFVSALGPLYAPLGQHGKLLDAYAEGHRKGQFFGLHPQLAWLRPLRELPAFRAAVERDRALREHADATTPMRYEVLTPAGYAAGRKRPVVIVLHGGGSSIEREKGFWKAAILDRGFLVASIQSSRHFNSNTFVWPGRDAEARAGIRRLYGEIAAKYSIDADRVLIGGMSAGGMMALDVAFHDVLPIAGLIVNCPVVPPDFEPPMAARLARRGVRGAIITGERDFALGPVKAMAAELEKAGVRHTFTVVPGMDHVYPPDFRARLGAALDALLPVPPDPMSGRGSVASPGGPTITTTMIGGRADAELLWFRRPVLHGGSLRIAGTTKSDDVPATSDAPFSKYHGGNAWDTEDGFVARLDARSGRLEYAT
jgi:acetyl esterase/lipase